jgi:hypothetical protein
VGERFSGLAYDSLRREYTLFVNNGGQGYLTLEEMHAGNCSAVKTRWSGDNIGLRYGGAEYVPQLDALIVNYGFDGNLARNDWTVIDMASGNETYWRSVVATNHPMWTGNNWLYGEQYVQPNGTVWSMGPDYGPGFSSLLQLDFGNNLTALFTNDTIISGSRMSAIMPRALRALSDGPALTVKNKWRTGYTGSVIMVSPQNDLYEVNLDTPGIRKIGRASSQIVALESLGTWDNIYALINSTTGTGSLARVNLTTGQLTTVASLPAVYSALTLNGDGSFLAVRALNDSFSELARISPAGVVDRVTPLDCVPAECRKMMRNGGSLYLIEDDSTNILQRNGSDYSALPINRDVSGICVDTPVGPDGGCSGWMPGFSSKMVDVSGYTQQLNSTLYSMDVAVGRASSFYHWNITSGFSWSIVDVDVPHTDFAYFQYNRAYCNNLGNWNGEMCVCDNASILGNRCQTVLPPPVAPPVAVPVDAPANAPSAGSTAPKASAKTPSISGASHMMMNIIVVLAAALALLF